MLVGVVRSKWILLDLLGIYIELVTWGSINMNKPIHKTELELLYPQ